MVRSWLSIQKSKERNKKLKTGAMKRNQVRNQVSDYVEYEFDRLHRRIGDRMVYPLAAVEGAVQGVARGVHNMVRHNKHHSDRVTGGHGRCNCNSAKPHGHGSAYAHPVGPYECWGYTPPPATSLPPPGPPPPPPPQFQYHPAFPMPCRPPY